jgi:hypothetical protein
MSTILFSWVQPKSGAPIRRLADVREHWYLILFPMWVLSRVVLDVLHSSFDGASVFHLALCLAMLNYALRILRPTYQMTKDGLRIRC